MRGPSCAPALAGSTIAPVKRSASIAAPKRWRIDQASMRWYGAISNLVISVFVTTRSINQFSLHTAAHEHRVAWALAILLALPGAARAQQAVAPLTLVTLS